MYAYWEEYVVQSFRLITFHINRKHFKKTFLLSYTLPGNNYCHKLSGLQELEFVIQHLDSFFSGVPCQIRKYGIYIFCISLISIEILCLSFEQSNIKMQWFGRRINKHFIIVYVLHV